MKMWISRKKWNALVKKIADLEVQVQSQQKCFKEHVNDHEQSVKELKDIIESIKYSTLMV